MDANTHLDHWRYVMKRFIALTFIAALVLGLTSCSDEVSTAPDSQDVVITGVDKDPPANSGPNVVRYEDSWGNYWVFVWDYLDNLEATVMVGFDPQAICNGEPWPSIPIMEVNHPQDQFIVNQLIHAQDVAIYVYDGIWPGGCDFFLENDPLFWGTGNFNSTDNDLYAYIEGNDSPRVNSYGIVCNGQLEDADGNGANVHLVYRAVWPGWPADPALFEFKVDRARINFTH